MRALSAAAAAAGGAAAAAAAQQPANVLLLMADQMRADMLSPTLTPNLWALAQQGLRFNHFYSSTPTCTPARSALLTGRSPWGHGMLGYGTVAPAWPLEMATHLGSLGYDTAVVGKNHFITANGENASTVPAHGFQWSQLYDGLGDGMDAASGELDDYDVWFAAQTNGSNPLATCGQDWNSWAGCPSGYEYPERLHPTAWVGATAEGWLRNRTAAAAAAAAGGEEGGAPPPFFFKVSWHRPHSPYDPPQRVYNATPEAPPPVVAGTWDTRFTTNNNWCGPDQPDAWCGTMPPAAAAEARRSYRASVAFVDEHVGRVLAAADLASTWVLFISDHGDGQGDHGLWRKGYPFQLSVNVPGILRWPDGYAAAVSRGSTTDALAEVRDVFPTVAAIAGAWPLPAGHTVEGAPLTCLVGGPAAPPSCSGLAWRTALDLEHDIVYNTTNHWNALVGDGLTPAGRGRRVKFIFWASTATAQLFDLTSDPAEMKDLAGDPAWAAELGAWRAAMAAQFTREGRGPAWVSPAGELLPRVAGQLCSPNFPDRSFC